MPGINGVRPPALLPVPGQSAIRPMFRSMAIAASGLSAQRQRMETIAQNIANADVTRGLDNEPYKRRTVVLETATAQNATFDAMGPASPFGTGSNSAFGKALGAVGGAFNGDGVRSVQVPVLPLVGNGATGNGATGNAPIDVAMRGQFGVRVAGIAEDVGEGRVLYEPGHPDADEHGNVRYPNVNTTLEIADMMDARRMYEANASVFQTAKAMLRASLDI